MKAVVVARRQDAPELLHLDEVLLVAGSTPCLSYRFDEAEVYGYHRFTEDQQKWFDREFLKRMMPDSVVKI